MKPPEFTDFKAVPLPAPASTAARCVTVIDVGTVDETYKNETKKARKIYIAWELPRFLAKFHDDQPEQPFLVGIELTFSTSDRANFSKLVANWRNKPLTEAEKKTFDPTIMINKTALVSFVHARKSKYKGAEIGQVTNENSVLKFNGIAQLPSEMTCPPMISKKLVWDWDAIEEGKAEFDKELFEKIPKWIREKMMASEEFAKFGKGYDQADDAQAADGEPDEPVEPDTNGGW
jgi:hypothetical protein